MSFLHSQGVLGVRKRITLMVITVSVMFAICWGAESVEYVLRIVSNLNIIFVHITTVDMKMLFNSAANPLCVCPPELSVQTRGQGNDVLHTPYGTQALG